LSAGAGRVIFTKVFLFLMDGVMGEFARRQERREERPDDSIVRSIESETDDTSLGSLIERQEALLERQGRAEQDATAARELRQNLELTAQQRQERYPEDLYSDFASDKTSTGKIALFGEVKEAVEKNAAHFRRQAKFMTNTITGVPIAVEYAGRTNNFSTQTRIMELPDGRKVFAVYDHKGSVVHRALDGVMKWASGLRMHKVSRKKWKRQFEEKSNIPTIENSDPDTVLMPFHPNVNGNDLFGEVSRTRREDGIGEITC
jgi:hypothetical protein